MSNINVDQATPVLSDQEILRYSRQINLTNFDFDKQEILKQSSILILGAGGLGCAASQYLCAAGVGSLTLVDDDKVELSNLHRQILHTDADIGSNKIDSAKQSLQLLNPQTRINTIARRLDDAALDDLIMQHDLVIDASDNLITREQLNRLCYYQKKPLVSGAAIRMEGQISVFTFQDPKDACYQCFSVLFGNNNLTCVEAGIMSPVVGIIGSMQALEAIKILTNYGNSCIGKILIFDALNLSWQSMKLNKMDNCPVCS